MNYKTIGVGKDYIKVLPIYRGVEKVNGVEQVFANIWKVVAVGDNISGIKEGTALILSTNYSGEEVQNKPMYIRESQIYEYLEVTHEG